MSLSNEFRMELDRIYDSLGLGHGERVAPVEAAPPEEFERQVLNTRFVFLLLAWVERLVAEVDELRSATGSGENPRD